MNALHESVVRHLVAQKGHEMALELWNKLWSKYEKGGSEALEVFLEEIRDVPQEEE